VCVSPTAVMVGRRRPCSGKSGIIPQVLHETPCMTTTRLDAHIGAYTGNNLYDFDNQILLNWYARRIAMNSEGARSILELGLGHGYTTNTFAGRFDRHVVIEGSPAVIGHFRENFPDCRAEIVQGYFEEFLSPEQFDVIVMGFILEHVDDPARIIRKFKASLAAGGKMFVAVPNAEVMNRRLGHLAGMLKDMQELSENDLLLGHKRYYTVRSLSAEIETAGCRVEAMEGIYLKPLSTRQMLALNLDKEIIRALCELGVDYPELSCGILARISAD
jgi:trans-aconitate methyltransferase